MHDNHVLLTSRSYATRKVNADAFPDKADTEFCSMGQG